MLTFHDVWGGLPTAWGGPSGEGILRTTPEDFQVVEKPITVPSGDGEHLWLRIRKTSCNTDWVANTLASTAGLKTSAVSYAGMKDRHAVTTQWFSVHLPGKPDPDWSDLQDKGFEILESQRHHRKLKRGGLINNAFNLVIREITGDKNIIEQRIASLKEYGVPNYFGNQRFGRGGQNLNFALKLFNDRRFKTSRIKKGIYLSAARSAIFNRILAARIAKGNWNMPLLGEACQLDAKTACFVVDQLDEEIVLRSVELEIHPTGALWGKGEYLPTDAAKELEQEIVLPLSEFTQGLVDNGVDFSRRALRVPLTDIRYEWLSEQSLRLSFTLPPGSYATALLREILNAKDSVPRSSIG